MCVRTHARTPHVCEIYPLPLTPQGTWDEWQVGLELHSQGWGYVGYHAIVTR